MNTKVNKSQNSKTKVLKKQIAPPPPKLTTAEKARLEECIMLHDWHFDVLFRNKCTQIANEIIEWKNDHKEIERIYIYGLKAVNSETKKDTIANFFIKYNFRVYQAWGISNALDIKNLLFKEYHREKYEDKLYDEKMEKQEKEKHPLQIKAA